MRIPGFRIERTIGKGGMATVYLATQASLGRTVALKTLAMDGPDEEEDDAATIHEETLSTAERFLNEGRIVAALEHPNIIRIYDVGATDAVMYFSMEYLGGGDLQARLAGPLAVEEAIEILLDIGLALECAHGKGIVHRDVKPANILFRADGTPLLSDFGIAKNLASDASLTTTGRVIGSPFYLSPEQADGVGVDGRADIYSLGVICFEMLTGRRPYDGPSAMQVLIHHLQSPVPRLPEGLRRFQPLVDRMMAKDPNDRFANAGEMARGLEAVRDELAEGPAPLPAGAGEGAAGCARGKRPLDATMADVVERFRNGILEDVASDRIVLPSLPDVVVQVRSALEAPDANSDRIAAVIASDPALSAQVLRVANSAFYRGAGAVGDLGRAVTRLGTAVVQQVVMMLVVAQLYNVDSRPRIKPHLKALWRHSTLVAALCQLLAKRISGMSADVAMLAGLVHDIGTLPVLVWADQIPHVIGNPQSLSRLVDALHAELGGAILEAWRYPPDLVAVAAEHEVLDRARDGGPDYTDVVTVANVLAHAGEDHPLGAVAWSELPAFERLPVSSESVVDLLESAREHAAALGDALEGAG